MAVLDEPAKCYLCSQPIDGNPDDAYCYGCQQFVCDTCDVASPMGEHDPEAHCADDDTDLDLEGF